MSKALASLAGWVRTHPRMLRLARSSIFLIPDIPWTVNVPQLGRMRIRLRRHRWMFFEDPATSDPHMVAVFERLIRPGDVVYDIGANIGLYTRMISQRFEAGKVIAFEPMTDNLDLLRGNVELGEIEEDVVIYPLALSDHDGEESLQIDDMFSGTAVLDTIAEGRASEGRQRYNLPPVSEQVQVMKFDTVFEQESLPPPNVIKIDTEGAEAKVLAGARQTLQAYRPRMTIALHGDDKAVATLALLDELNCYVYGFVRNKSGSAAYQRLRTEHAENICNNNIVASWIEDDIREKIEETAI